MFNYPLDGLLADEGTDFWECCFSLPENSLPDDPEQLDLLPHDQSSRVSSRQASGVSSAEIADTSLPWPRGALTDRERGAGGHDGTRGIKRPDEQVDAEALVCIYDPSDFTSVHKRFADRDLTIPRNIGVCLAPDFPEVEDAPPSSSQLASRLEFDVRLKLEHCHDLSHTERGRHRRVARGSRMSLAYWTATPAVHNDKARLKLASGVGGGPYPFDVELVVPDRPLGDDVVTLRPPREDDLRAIGRGISDPDVVRWIGPFDSAREVLERNLSRWAEGTRATFSICDQKDVCLGHVWVILADPEDSNRGSVGYWLLPEARGNGFATRSVQLISRWALGDLGLARLSLFAEPSNEESRRVAQRSGYMEEGVLRSYMEIGDRRVDCVVFSLLPVDLTSHHAG